MGVNNLNLVRLLEKLAYIINKNKDFLLVTHTYPDGDALGSLVALYELICRLKKNAIMVCVGDIPYQYKFLPSINKIKTSLDNINDIDKKYITICLDSADENRMDININRIKEKSLEVINIDHHMGNTKFGNINIIGPEKSATAEILYELIDRNFKNYLNYNIAIGIYTGILTDTGKFQYSSTSSNVHRIISELLKYGIKSSKVFSSIYENEPMNRFKLIKLILERIKLVKSKKLIYSYILQYDFEKLNLPFSSQDGVIELLRSAKDAEIAALFKQTLNDSFKVSLRSSSSNYNVAKIARLFGGGGHSMASAYVQKGKLNDVILGLVDAVKRSND
jgi:phosphoesterase RecJ-like protein